MNKITALIVDDEMNARKVLINMIDLYCPQINIIGEATDISEASKQISLHQPELVFLDIQMPGGSGLDLLNRFKTIPFKVIFVSAHAHYALQAIKLSALDYLLKPISPRELIKAIEKVSLTIEKEEQLNQKIETLISNCSPEKQDRKIILNTSTDMFVVKIEMIIRLEADENYTHVVLSNGKKILVSRSLKEFDEILNSFGFGRVHQSHLINLDHICRYEKSGSGFIELTNGEKIPVATRRKEYFFSLLKKFI